MPPQGVTAAQSSFSNHRLTFTFHEAVSVIASRSDPRSEAVSITYFETTKEFRCLLSVLHSADPSWLLGYNMEHSVPGLHCTKR